MSSLASPVAGGQRSHVALPCMGKEAAGAASAGARSGAVKAHLDGERLRLSGAFRIVAALGELGSVAVRGDALTVAYEGETYTLALGAETAAAWAKAIAHPKTLIEKLDLKAGQRVCTLGLDGAFANAVATVTLSAPATALRGSFDAIFCAIESTGDLERVTRCRERMQPAAALWLVSPKGKTAPVHENVIREAIFAVGLVDTKVVSFSPTHTAVKAVIPLASRPKKT